MANGAGRRVKKLPAENERRVREQWRALPGHRRLCEHAITDGWPLDGLMQPDWESLLTTYRWPMISSKDGGEEEPRLNKSFRWRGTSTEPDRAAYGFERSSKAGQERIFPE